jgi:hypothetical protein
MTVCLARLEAGIEENRSEQGFQRVGQNGWPAKAAAFQLTLAQAQVFAKLQAVGISVQGFLAHQIGAQAGQVAFPQLAGKRSNRAGR